MGGLYFVTLNVKERYQCLGVIIDGKMQLTAMGKVVADCWQELPEHFSNMELDEWVVMPDHVHGIIRIKEAEPLSVNDDPWGSAAYAGALGTIIGSFKSAASKLIRRSLDPTFQWQRSFHDAIITDPKHLENVRRYIQQNPSRWQQQENSGQG